MSPAVSYVSVDVAGGPGSPLFALDRRSGREEWRMAERAFRGRAARWLPVKVPEAYAGEVFRTVAAQHGITLGPVRTGPAPQIAQVVASHRSRALGDIVRLTALRECRTAEGCRHLRITAVRYVEPEFTRESLIPGEQHRLWRCIGYGASMKVRRQSGIAVVKVHGQKSVEGSALKLEWFNG